MGGCALPNCLPLNKWRCSMRRFIYLSQRRLTLLAAQVNDNGVL
jgi:hypothetical protein